MGGEDRRPLLELPEYVFLGDSLRTLLGASRVQRRLEVSGEMAIQSLGRGTIEPTGRNACRTVDNCSLDL